MPYQAFFIGIIGIMPVRVSIIPNKKAELPQRRPRDAPYGYPENFRVPEYAHGLLFPKFLMGVLFRSIL